MNISRIESSNKRIESAVKICEIVEQTIELTGSGRSADIAVKAVLVNLLRDDAPFHGIEMKEPRHLVPLMKDADHPHVYSERSTFYFTAHYSHSEDFPIGRSYFIREADIFKVARLHKFFQEQGFSLPIIPPQGLGARIGEEGFRDRIKAYKERKEIEWAPFKGLFEGRKDARIVEQSIFLNSPGCLICGSPHYFMMTSCLNASAGMMVGFNLCQNHLDESNTFNSLIEYLASRFKCALPIHVQPLDVNSHFAMVIAWLPDAVSTTIEKVQDRTLTLVRKSQFKLIVRLDSLSNYAYVILNPNGKEVARFDSVDHHDVPYGPDHLHPNLPKDKTAQSSFTTGTPMIDANRILDVIRTKEREFANES